MWLTRIAPMLLITVGLANAGEVDVPNRFNPGTPARASEVNQNFNALEAAINDNASRLEALEQGSGAEPVAIDVEQQNAMVGDAVDIGGEFYTIAALEFVRMDNDVNYVFEYPGGASSGQTLVSLRYNVTWVPEPTPSSIAATNIAAYAFTLNGFPAVLTQRYEQLGVPGVTPGVYEYIPTIFNTLEVQIGPETLLTFGTSYRTDNVESKADRQAALDAYLDRLPYFEIRPR